MSLRASAFVGRVGLLAAALGIGAAIGISGAGSAWGAPSDSVSSADESDSTSGRISPRAQAQQRHDGGGRRNQPTLPGADGRQSTTSEPSPAAARRRGISVTLGEFPDPSPNAASVTPLLDGSDPRGNYRAVGEPMVLRSVVAAANGTSNPLPPIASEGAAAPASASATQVAAPFGVLMSVSNPLLETDPQAPLDSVAAFELLTALRRGSGRSKTLASAFVPTTGQMPSAATAVISRTPIPAASPGRTAGEWSNTSAFAALKDDGSVVTWGGATGGYSDRVATKLSSGVVQIYSSQGAFAALKSDGSVVTWGSSSSGGDSSAVADKLTGGVTRIFSTQRAFAALKSDGTVVTWGDSSRGGNSDSVVNQLRDVRTIYSTDSAFAALRSDNSVVTWGDANYGGSTRFLAYSGWVDVAPQVSSGVSQIFSNYSAFAALKTDGSVVTWGWAASGGDSSVFAAALSSGVKEIASSRTGFTALKNSGSAVSWGIAVLSTLPAITRCKFQLL